MLANLKKGPTGKINGSLGTPCAVFKHCLEKLLIAWKGQSEFDTKGGGGGGHWGALGSPPPQGEVFPSQREVLLSPSGIPPSILSQVYIQIYNYIVVSNLMKRSYNVQITIEPTAHCPTSQKLCDLKINTPLPTL